MSQAFAMIMITAVGSTKFQWKKARQINFN